jgi:AAA domain
VISFVLGAPGAGKSTIVRPLRELLPGRVVLDWDVLMDSAGLLAGTPIRETPSTWEAYSLLVRTVAEQVLPIPIVLLGVCTPEELSDWPDGRWLLLDCADDVRRSRLVSRDDPDETAEALVDAAAYRSLGLPSIDSTDRPPADVARAIADWVDRPAG